MEPDQRNNPSFFFRIANPRYRPNWSIGLLFGLGTFPVWVLFVIANEIPLWPAIIIVTLFAGFGGICMGLMFGAFLFSLDIFSGRFDPEGNQDERVNGLAILSQPLVRGYLAVSIAFAFAVALHDFFAISFLPIGFFATAICVVAFLAAVFGPRLVNREGKRHSGDKHDPI